MTIGTNWTKAHQAFLERSSIAAGTARALQCHLANFLSRSHGDHEGLFPDRRVEDWKYTSLAHLTEMEAVAQLSPRVPDARALDHALATALRPLGFQPEELGLSTMPAASRTQNVVLVMSGGTLLRLHVPDALQPSVSVTMSPGPASDLGSDRDRADRDQAAKAVSPQWGHALESLHGAFHKDTIRIDAVKTSTNSKPNIFVVEVHGTVPAAEDGSLSVSEIHVTLRAGARARIVQVQADPRHRETLNLTKLTIDLEAGSDLDHFVAQETLEGQNVINTTRITCAEGASYRSLGAVRGEGLVRNHIDAALTGVQASAWIGSCVHPQRGGHLDHLTRVRHESPQTSSTQLYKHLVDDQGHVVFRGTISIAAGADGSEAHQTSRSLLLGPQSQADTKPELIIAADDVVCSHGATVGPLSGDEVFYLQSRGLTRTEAVALLCTGFLEEPAQALGDRDLATWALRWLAPKKPFAPTEEGRP